MKRARRSAPPASLELLRSAFIANPEDRQTISVYADAVLESGAPWGEDFLIAMNDDAPHEPSSFERQWAGRLEPKLADFRVFRGQLWDVQLPRVTPTQFRRLVGLSEWETVRRIEFLRGRTKRRTQRLPVAPVVELISHPVMRSLKELYAFELEPLLELAGRRLAARIESVNLIVDRVPHVPAQPYPGLNHLRRLSIDLREYLPPWMIDVLIDLPFVRRLETFDCDSSLGFTTQQLERLLTRPALQRLTLCDFEARRVGQKWDLVIHAPASWGTMTLLGRLSPLRTMVNTLTVAPAPGQPRDEDILDLESHLRDVLEGAPAWVEDPAEDAPF